MVNNIGVENRNHMLGVLLPQIRKAARTVAAGWPGVVEQDDMEQELSLHLLEREGVLQRLFDSEDKERMQALIWWGNQIAKKERADFEVFSGNFRYSVNEVKRLLEDGLLKGVHDSNGESSWSSADYVNSGESVEDTVLTRYTTELDLKHGMNNLADRNKNQASLIVRRHLLGQELQNNERARLSDAVKSLTDEMNRSYKKQHHDRPDGPGTRTVISNAAAAAITATQYNGDRGDGRW
jgi:hypothetical protein